MWSYLGLSSPAARSALPSSPPPVPVPNGDEGSVVVEASTSNSTNGDRGLGGGGGGFRVSLPTHGRSSLTSKSERSVDWMETECTETVEHRLFSVSM